MLKPRLLRSGASPRIAATPHSISSHTSILAAFTQLSLAPSRIQSRSASHAAQGRANGAAPGPGKRLGAKKGERDLVVPGNIIFRQRGSLWFPGENCVMGRDFTISALAKGYVRYYRDPVRHPTRKFIGVVFDIKDRLPYPLNSARRRRLGLEVVPLEKQLELKAERAKKIPKIVVAGFPPRETQTPARLRTTFQVRPTNTEIGRTRAPKPQIRKKSEIYGIRARTPRKKIKERNMEILARKLKYGIPIKAPPKRRRRRN